MPAVMVRGFRSSLVVAALACGVLLVGGVAEGAAAVPRSIYAFANGCFAIGSGAF
jgi:hypothetical protein